MNMLNPLRRFLKSVMEQVGTLAGQKPDEDEDDTIPSMSPQSYGNSFTKK